MQTRIGVELSSPTCLIRYRLFYRCESYYYLEAVYLLVVLLMVSPYLTLVYYTTGMANLKMPRHLITYVKKSFILIHIFLQSMQTYFCGCLTNFWHKNVEATDSTEKPHRNKHK